MELWQGSELEREKWQRLQRWKEELMADRQWQERKQGKEKGGGSNKQLYAIDSENIEESAENEEDLQAWCLLEESGKMSSGKR